MEEAKEIYSGTTNRKKEREEERLGGGIILVEFRFHSSYGLGMPPPLPEYRQINCPTLLPSTPRSPPRLTLDIIEGEEEIYRKTTAARTRTTTQEHKKQISLESGIVVEVNRSILSPSATLLLCPICGAER